MATVRLARAAPFSDEDRKRWLQIASIRDDMKKEVEILRTQQNLMFQVRTEEMQNYQAMGLELTLVQSAINKVKFNELKKMYENVNTRLTSDMQRYNSKIKMLVKSLDDYSNEGWTISAKYEKGNDPKMENDVGRMADKLTQGDMGPPPAQRPPLWRHSFVQKAAALGQTRE